jgi:hypothetical protein
MNAASVDFSELREQRCENRVRAADQTARVRVQVVVRFTPRQRGGRALPSDFASF